VSVISLCQINLGTPCILSDRLTYSLDFFRASFKILSHMSRERMGCTATGICYSFGIPQVLLKVTIKFKNANLFLNVILNWTLSSNNTCPAFSWNRLRYKIQQRSKLLARMGVVVFYWHKYILLATMTETVSAMEARKITLWTAKMRIIRTGLEPKIHCHLTSDRSQCILPF